MSFWKCVSVYYMARISEVIRVPPNRFGEPIEDVILELCRTKYESSISPEYGMILGVISLEELSPGRIVPGDGATFHEVEFIAVSFRPLDGEVVEGEVVETTKFGVFMRIGCTDALCHVSQLSDDFFSISTRSKGVLVGRESGRSLRLGDVVRAKIITASIDHISLKIAVSMRHPGLGARTWLEEPNGDQEGAETKT